jgi:plasmid maintenance system antidote protein VapI
MLPRTPIHPGEHLWMNLQQQYELRLAEKEVGAQVASLPRHVNAQTTRNLGKTA